MFLLAKLYSYSLTSFKFLSTKGVILFLLIGMLINLSLIFFFQKQIFGNFKGKKAVSWIYAETVCPRRNITHTHLKILNEIPLCILHLRIIIPLGYFWNVYCYFLYA